MQVSVEATGTLERRMRVSIPAERLSSEIDNRLSNLSRSARLPGFRPGKVPLRVIRQKFGRQVRAEVTQELISNTFQDAVAQENLRPAGGPRVEPQADAGSEGFEYVAVFEVFPEVRLAAMDDVEIQRPQAEVTDSDIDNMIEKLRQQRRRFEAVERGAESGDRVTIDFVGRIDGEAFEGGTANGVPLELGSGQFIPGFEDGLIGIKAGESRTVSVTFPEDYGRANLAGKAAEFEVQCHQVSAPQLPAVDEEFAQAFGVFEGGVEGLRAEVRRNMERELRQVIKNRLKQQVFDALVERHPIELPAALIDDEVTRLQQEMRGNNPQAGALPREALAPQARRRVLLGLLIAEVVKVHGLQLDAEKVRETVETIASSYEQPEEVVRYYYENREAMASAQSLALEDQVLDWAVGQARVVDKAASFDEIIGNAGSSAA